jgi:hypothetical protein
MSTFSVALFDEEGQPGADEQLLDVPECFWSPLKRGKLTGQGVVGQTSPIFVSISRQVNHILQRWSHLSTGHTASVVQKPVP